jgi:hypothetical protein
MHRLTKIFIILVTFSFGIAACSQAITNLPESETPTSTPVPIDTITPASTHTPTPVSIQIPPYAFNVEVENDSYSFETGAPIPSVAVFFKNQFLNQGCTLVNETGGSMDPITLAFENCSDHQSIQVLIFPNNNQGSKVSLSAIP